MRITVTSTIDGLEEDRRDKAKTFRRNLGEVVRDNAREGNRIAKAHASEDHTMFGDADIAYPPSFKAQSQGPLTWVYGPVDGIGDGSQASGYEFGSINSPPHFDLARSVDYIGQEFQNDVEDLLTRTFA